jgi:hypothetical protein
MGLLLAIPVGETGVSARYWRITAVQADFSAVPADATPEQEALGVLDVTLQGYLDHAARLAGRTPLHAMRLRFGPAETGPLDGVAVASIYAAVKTAAAFTGAVDA